MHRKGAQDQKRAKIFAKLSKEISVAAREGVDQEFNARLRVAIAAAKAQNMPNDNIKRAIQRAEGGEADNFEEIRYEGYGPGGVALIAEILTDNRNRAASEIRSIFSKNGGALGETGSVSFMFSRIGIVIYSNNSVHADDIFNAALEAGANDIVSSDNRHEVICTPDSFNHVREALEGHFGVSDEAVLVWRPKDKVQLDSEKVEMLCRLIEALEDNDDVQTVAVNFDFDQEPSYTASML